MNLIKKFLKNKKGSPLIEMIMLLPFLLYLIFFSTFKVASYNAFSAAYQLATNYTRELIVCKTSEEMFDVLARQVYDAQNEDRHTKTNDSITNIRITTMSALNESVNVSFDAYLEGGNTFASFCYLDNGVPKFDYQRWATRASNSADLENKWEHGALIELTLSRDLTTDILKEAFSFEVYVFGDNEKKVLTMGIDTDIQVIASNVIST